ncbi:hypothetical protein [Leekyejoonella antrihumi]|uniref:Uncharacterized protein n=1 Tax=Leekyejoonella antrihumi TaxID=1660198 RepID=A0A563DU05_9MICO|nr:hypothetical protein [Leekyejoonella antrihumi]TWP33740.1 hypothetical protein FGL98_20075 [Leekyejoonella antrihumi]
MSDFTPPGGEGDRDQPPRYPGAPGYDASAPGAMPGGESAMVTKPPVPKSLAMAVNFMYAGAVVSLISLIITLFSRGAIHDAVVKASNQSGAKHLTATEISTAVNVSFGIGIVLGIIGVGLWVLMARKNQDGRWWARVVATVLTVLAVLSTLSTLTRSGSTAFTTILSIVTVIIAIIATVLLYRPDSGEFFAQCKAMRNPR